MQLYWSSKISQCPLTDLIKGYYQSSSVPGELETLHYNNGILPKGTLSDHGMGRLQFGPMVLMVGMLFFFPAVRHLHKVNTDGQQEVWNAVWFVCWWYSVIFPFHLNQERQCRCLTVAKSCLGLTEKQIILPRRRIQGSVIFRPRA